MPIYEYECSECKDVFEVKQSFSEDSLEKCEKCSGKLRKMIHPPAIHFKGTGWYITDYARKSDKPSPDEKDKKKPCEDAKSSSDSSKPDTKTCQEKCGAAKCG